MSTLAELLDLVELDLRDAGNANWSTAELTQHLRRALHEINSVNPQRKVGTINAAAGTREYSLAALTGLLKVYDVWYPYTVATPEYPAERPAWELLYDGQLYIDVVDEPILGQVLRVFYSALHTISGLDAGAATTLSARQESVLVLGATAYAAYQYAQDLIGEVSPSGMSPQQIDGWAHRRENMYRFGMEQLRKADILMQDPRVVWAAATRAEGRGGVV